MGAHHAACSHRVMANIIAVVGLELSEWNTGRLDSTVPLE